MDETALYQSPWTSRYSSKEMSTLFSAQHKYFLWRLLWLALAKAQKKLGLPITQKQVDVLEQHLHTIDFAVVRSFEKKFRHEVMAHIHAFGSQCPEALPILHLGATSTFVTDNGELLQIHQAMELLQRKLVQIIRNLARFSQNTRNIPCLSWTHLQAAQPTTIGKRGCLWLQDFATDLVDVEDYLKNFKFLGLKGATGTQASFVALFHGDLSKVQELEKAVAKEMGFSHLYTITSQTYPRKHDHKTLSLLASIAISGHKIATDIRLLAHMQELEEPFQDDQIGSSAMPYKRNPMLCERICGLARFLITLSQNASHTAANQWLERTLDDSSNRRLTLSEGFLCADAILDLVMAVTKNMTFYPQNISEHLNQALPFLATENIIMAAVKQGRDRQKVHERLRIHSQRASARMKTEGKTSDFVENVIKDPEIGISREQLEEICQVNAFLGRAPEQVREYLHNEIDRLLEKYKTFQEIVATVEI